MAVLDIFPYQLGELVVLESPSRGCEQVWRRLAGEALEDDVGTSAADELGDEAGIAVGCEAHEVGGMLCVVVGHGCAADDLQLM